MNTETPVFSQFNRDVSDYLIDRTKNHIHALCQSVEDELGILDLQGFEDAFVYQTDSNKPDAEFAQFYSEEINCTEIPSYLVIDWNLTYHSWYRHYFYSITIDELTYYFHRS